MPENGYLNKKAHIIIIKDKATYKFFLELLMLHLFKSMSIPNDASAKKVFIKEIVSMSPKKIKNSILLTLKELSLDSKIKDMLC